MKFDNSRTAEYLTSAHTAKPSEPTATDVVLAFAVLQQEIKMFVGDAARMPEFRRIMDAFSLCQNVALHPYANAEDGEAQMKHAIAAFDAFNRDIHDIHNAKKP